MKPITVVFAASLLASGLMLAGPGALAGEPSGCEDLGEFPEAPGVDFENEIQPILDSCTGCHGENGQGGLDLRPGESWGNLVDQPSLSNPDRLRVAPFDPEESSLFLAVNCEDPGGPGFQMPGVDLEARALIRDWIAQGALEEPEPEPTPDPVTIPVLGQGGLVIMALLLGLLGLLAVRRPI